ncbi:MAG TPA: hypothetical protein VM925_06260, partial [Labilithrix sp.]|nr:hypothetical protein [Labilithrix sp.]
MPCLNKWISVAVLASIAVIAANVEAAPKKKPKKPDTIDAPKTEEVGSEFDKRAAVSAITEVNLQKCKTTNASTGEGHVTITFAPAGEAQTVLDDKGPWVGPPVAQCMQKEFKK